MANKSTIPLTIEQWGPLFAGVATFVILIVNQDSVSAKFVPTGWSLSNLYGAVFNWAALQSGFLFSVYGFVVGKQDGFVSAIKRSIFLSRFVGYTKTAIILGFLLTFSSIPLVVMNLDFTGANNLNYISVSVWVGLFSWAFFSFLRVAYIFDIIARVRDKED